MAQFNQFDAHINRELCISQSCKCPAVVLLEIFEFSIKHKFKSEIIFGLPFRKNSNNK